MEAVLWQELKTTSLGLQHKGRQALLDPLLAGKKTPICRKNVVGDAGFEPATSSL